MAVSSATKNMLSVLTQVFYTVCIVTMLWALYGYSLAFTRRHHDFIGGFSKAFLMGVTPNSKAATFSVDANISGAGLLLLPDDLRGDHAGPDRRRVRRTHEVRGGGAVHPALGDADLFPDRAHGLVLGRTGCDLGCGQGAGRRGGRCGQDRGAGQARRSHRPTPAGSSRRARSTSPAAPWCTSTPVSPVSSAR